MAFVYESRVLRNYISAVRPFNGDTSFQKPLRILSLGGINCAGTKLGEDSDGLQPYPHLIGKDNIVINLARRTTAASRSDYTSHCIQSMLSDAFALEGINEKEQQDHAFDVILLDYSIEKLANIDLLLKRLRARYPSALIIYIHSWSPLLMLQDVNNLTGQRPCDCVMGEDYMFQTFGLELENNGDRDGVRDNIHAEWGWNPQDLDLVSVKKQKVAEAVAAVGGVMWEFPLYSPITMFHYYMKDRHHLNFDGHALVAQGIREVIQDHIPHGGVRAGGLHIGTWGRGDQCYSWFDTGDSPLEHLHGEIRRFQDHQKYAHQVTTNDGVSSNSIIFDNKARWSMPVSIMHMVWKENHYPRAQVTLLSNDKIASIVGIEPFHPNDVMRAWHSQHMTSVGQASPGKNSLTFQCLDETELPLKITGVVMCAACQEVDRLLQGG